MKDNRHWSMQTFLILYGALGLGVAAWLLSQVIHYFILHSLTLIATSVVSFACLVVVGYLAVLIKLRRGSLERDYYKLNETYLQKRHWLLLIRSIIFSVIITAVSLFIGYWLPYRAEINWLGSAIGFFLCFGVIYCWQLWAVYCCQRFFSSFHSPLIPESE